jgi:chaperonin cofactor prefoldin
MECQYCKNIFKNISSLKNHQLTVKYCLKLQGKDTNLYNCEFCNKGFSKKAHLSDHNNICKSKKNIIIINEKEFYEKQIKEQKEFYENQLKEKEIQIKDLQNQIKELATIAINRPTTSVQNNNHQKINQVVNNLLPISDDHLKEQAQYLTIDHIKNGINGYTQYALEYPLKDRIICTDFSRKKIKYKDENGIIVDDPEMIKLSQKLFKAIEEKNDILIEEYIKELHDKHNILITEPNGEMTDCESNLYQKNLEMIFNELFKIKTQKREITEIANGTKNNIYNEFIKDVCTKTVR